MTHNNTANEVTRVTNELESCHSPVAEIECKCSSCGNSFIISVEEQKWYSSHDYTLPKRCLACRKIRRAERNAFNRGRRNMLNTIAAIGDSMNNMSK